MPTLDFRRRMDKPFCHLLVDTVMALYHHAGALLDKLVLTDNRFVRCYHRALRDARFRASFNLYTSMRLVENPWVLDRLPPLEGVQRILDVGCAGSYFHALLIDRGYDTWGLDYRDFPSRHPELRYIQRDIRDADLPSGLFDVILCISTLEHIGLGSYGDPTFERGDVLAFGEMERMLSQQGRLFLTVPFAKQYYVDWQRHYDRESLLDLTSGLSLESEDYFTNRAGSKWELTDPQLVQDGDHAVACLVLRKD